MGLQLLGNLAAIPFLRATGKPTEPVSAWILWTVVSVPIIGIGLYLAGRIGLGVPFVEGQLRGREISDWAGRVFALSLIVAIAGSVPFLAVNLNVNPVRYPALWTLFLASVKAGVREGIFMRLFLMTLLAWLGGLVQREEDGRPSPRVTWCSVILSGFLFGLGHVDQVLLDLEFPLPLGGYCWQTPSLGSPLAGCTGSKVWKAQSLRISWLMLWGAAS